MHSLALILHILPSKFALLAEGYFYDYPCGSKAILEFIAPYHIDKTKTKQNINCEYHMGILYICYLLSSLPQYIDGYMQAV